jgi:DNA-binding PadR family transcriptional regulator
MGHPSRQLVEFSSKEIVLGLLIERPDHPYRLDQRLNRLLSGAQYARGTAGKALKTLVDDGFVRLAEGDAQSAAYEATLEGVAHFRSWLLASTSIPPVREELHAKIALCELADLPSIIDLVKDLEVGCLAELQAANRRAKSALLTVGERKGARRTGIIVAAGDAAWWDGRIKWLQSVRLYLEKEWQRYQAEQIAARSD